METTKIFFGSANLFREVKLFAMAPNICWGDLAVDRL